MYQPIIGGAKTGDAAEVSKPTGRPSGTDGVPQEEERGPTDVQNDAQPSIASEVNFSLAKVKDNLILAQHLNSDVEKALRSKHKIKRLTNKQKEIASDISEIIMANESPENWKSEIKNYIKSPIDKNPEQVKEINNLAATHQVDYYLASILFASKKDN